VPTHTRGNAPPVTHVARPRHLWQSHPQYVLMCNYIEMYVSYKKQLKKYLGQWARIALRGPCSRSGQVEGNDALLPPRRQPQRRCAMSR
jgi:hypothetical protein